MKWSEGRVEKELKDVIKELGFVPSTRILKEVKEGSLETYCFKFFGGYVKALKAIGIDYKWKRWDKKNIIREVKQISKKFNRTLSTVELKTLGRNDLVTTCRRYFGSYKKALIATNLKPYRREYKEKWTKEKVIKIIREYAFKYGMAPSRRDIIKLRGDSVVNAARRHFGSWSNAVRKSGIKPNPSGCSDKWRKWTRKTIIGTLRETAKVLGHSPFTIELENRNLSGLVIACRRVFGSYPRALMAAGLPIHRNAVENNFWRVWEEFCIKLVKIIYPSAIIKPTLPNRRIPDAFIPDKNLVIEIKTNVIGEGVIRDINNYSKFGNVEIWYLKGSPSVYRNLPQEVKFVGFDDIREMVNGIGSVNIKRNFYQILNGTQISRDLTGFLN